VRRRCATAREQSEVFQSQKFARRVPGLATIGYESTPKRERLVTILESSARDQTAPEAGAPCPCELGHQYFLNQYFLNWIA
jgi:hypothetical protein